VTHRSSRRLPYTKHQTAALGLCAAFILWACDAGGGPVLKSAPSTQQLKIMAARHATTLGRVSCSGCPDRWEPRACDFIEDTIRAPGNLDAARCAVVTVPIGRRAIPERLSEAATSTISTAVTRLGTDTRHREVDQALMLYAYGADLQRVGSLALWRDGLMARAQALAWLSDATPDTVWPAELLLLEETAPAPVKVTALVSLQTYNQLSRPGWGERLAVGDASTLTSAALRSSLNQQEDAVRKVRNALSAAWPDGKLPNDPVETWQAALLVRNHTQRVALTASLRSLPSCPGSLDELVPSRLRTVPWGWTLDPQTCLPRQAAAPPQLDPDEPTAGALAAER